MQIDMCLVRHVQHVQRHIHHQMVAILAKAVAMLPRRALVPNWHAANLPTVRHMPVARVHRERATGVITSLRPIHHAHRKTVLNLCPVCRAIRGIINLGSVALPVPTSQVTVRTPAQHRLMHVRGNVIRDII